jgi:hypothetical protein
VKVKPAQPPEEFTLTLHRKVKGVRKGWLVFESAFKPLDVNAPEYAKCKPFGKEGGLGKLYWESNDNHIQLQDMPFGAFRHAKDTKAEPAPYGTDTETVNWQPLVLQPERDIAFLYLIPPYHHLHGLPEPFLFVRSFGELGLVLLGLALAAVPTACVFVFRHTIGEWLKARLEKWRGKPPQSVTPNP